MRAAFAIPQFRRLFVALAATMVADSVLLLTFGISVKSLTGSSGAAGLSLFCVAAPSVVAPLLGWVVDRFPRRTFLLAGYPVAAATLLPLALVDGPADVGLVYAVAGAYGVALVMLPGAVSGLLKLVVPVDVLVHANAATGSFRQGLRLVGPLLGAGMYAAWGLGSVVALVVCGYAVATVAVLRLRVDDDVVVPPELHWRRELVGGVTHVLADRLLRWPLTALAGIAFVFGFTESLVYAICDAFDRPPTFVGVIVAVQGVGALAGGLTSGVLVVRIGHVRSLVLSTALFAVGLTTMALAPDIVVLVAGVVPLGFGLPLAFVALTTLTQVRTPHRLMARVSTTSDAVIGTPQVAAIALGSGVVLLLDYHVILAAMALAMAAIAVALGLWAHRTHPDEEVARDMFVPVA